jgi:HTH-type transcriptional regulator/antitoxin HipB
LDKLKKIRIEIARSVRELRQRRRLSQTDLAAELDLSQSRLSEIERGNGSFSAEQLIVLLRLFNVTVTQLSGTFEDNEEQQLHNALARLGAAQLFEDTNVIPSEALQRPASVIRQTLLAANPRMLTALGPVLVENCDELDLTRILAETREIGLGRRFAWVVENVYEALSALVALTLKRTHRRRFRRTELLLGKFLDRAYDQLVDEIGPRTWDIVDRNIRTTKTLEELEEDLSEISKRWGVISALQPGEFEASLRATYGY